MTKTETAFMELAYQIRKFLDEHGMQEADFAEKCGIKAATLEKAIGEQKIPTKDMQKICAVLEISMDSLRRVPVSGSFEALQLFVLDMVSRNDKSIQPHENEVKALMQGLPHYEQSRNLRWLRQAIEHPEFYGLQSRGLLPQPTRKRIFATSVAFPGLLHQKDFGKEGGKVKTVDRGFQEKMTVTIHSILNSVLWGLLLSVALSLLSRSKCSLCHMGTAPLIFLAGACLVRCCSPVEFAATQEVGTATLNHLHRFIGETAGTPLTEPWIYRIWAVGAAIWLVLWVPGYVYRLLSVQNFPISQDERINYFRRKHRIPNLRVAVTSRVDTPCVMGFWQETILLPDTAYTAKQLELILQHEYCHIKHRDGLLDFLLRILCTMFWWNPGIHICRVVITRLCDHRCDMEVLHAARPNTKFLHLNTERQKLQTMELLPLLVSTR